MRKRFSVAIAVILALVSGPLVYAEGQGLYMLTDMQISAIKSNCHSIQSTLTRIHTNDTLNRVHLGQEYETISAKFMAPMNSRVALMKLDGVELAKTTVDFNKQLDVFRDRYKQYDQSLLQAIQLKCTDQPVAFYDAIVQARDNRAAVKETIDDLGTLAVQYNNQVKELRAQALTAQKPSETGV